jgi:hypothetical protein
MPKRIYNNSNEAASLWFGLYRANAVRYSGTTAMLRAMAVASLVVISGHAFGQPATPQPEFEVASIKPAAPGAHGMFIRPTPAEGST